MLNSAKEYQRAEVRQSHLHESKLGSTPHQSARICGRVQQNRSIVDHYIHGLNSLIYKNLFFSVMVLILK